MIKNSSIKTLTFRKFQMLKTNIEGKMYSVDNNIISFERGKSDKCNNNYTSSSSSSDVASSKSLSSVMYPKVVERLLLLYADWGMRERGG